MCVCEWNDKHRKLHPTDPGQTPSSYIHTHTHTHHKRTDCLCLRYRCVPFPCWERIWVGGQSDLCRPKISPLCADRPALFFLTLVMSFIELKCPRVFLFAGGRVLAKHQGSTGFHRDRTASSRPWRSDADLLLRSDGFNFPCWGRARIFSGGRAIGTPQHKQVFLTRAYTYGYTHRNTHTHTHIHTDTDTHTHTHTHTFAMLNAVAPIVLRNRWGPI